MTDLIFPPSARISSITPKIVSNAASERSIFSSALRSMARAGDHFGFDFSIAASTDRETYAVRSALRSIRSKLRGQLNRIWFADPSYVARGSFPTGELASIGLFASSAGWSTSGATLSVADRIARVQNSGAAAGAIVNSTAIPLTVGNAYAVRVGLLAGNKAAWLVKGGTTSGASDELSSGALTAAGLYIGSFAASGANLFVSLICNSTTAGDFVHFVYLSVSRCFLVSGASQAGTDLTVDHLPLSSSGLLLPGDRVQIGTQLNSVAAPLNSDGSGNGYLQCDFPWRVSPANAGPIIVYAPMGRMAIADASPGTWDESPGGFADFSFSLEEALDL